MSPDDTPHAATTPTPPVPAEDADLDEREDGLAVSQAGSSFSDPETAQGGADAVPGTPDSTPVENHRENADLSDDDLRAFAEALSALPAPSPPGDALDPGLVARARALVGRHQCNACHGADLAGRDAIPRLRGQREEYLAASLTGYRTNARPGYDPAMNEVAQGLNEADIADLAAFLSRQ